VLVGSAFMATSTGVTFSRGPHQRHINAAHVVSLLADDD
jgi:hypothetical protein